MESLAADPRRGVPHVSPCAKAPARPRPVNAPRLVLKDESDRSPSGLVPKGPSPGFNPGKRDDDRTASKPPSPAARRTLAVSERSLGHIKKRAARVTRGSFGAAKLKRGKVRLNIHMHTLMSRRCRWVQSATCGGYRRRESSRSGRERSGRAEWASTRKGLRPEPCQGSAFASFATPVPLDGNEPW